MVGKKVQVRSELTILPLRMVTNIVPVKSEIGIGEMNYGQNPCRSRLFPVVPPKFQVGCSSSWRGGGKKTDGDSYTRTGLSGIIYTYLGT